MSKTVVISFLGLSLIAAVAAWLLLGDDAPYDSGESSTKQETSPGNELPPHQRTLQPIEPTVRRADPPQNNAEAPGPRADPKAIEALRNTIIQLDEAIENAPSETTREVLERKKAIVERSLAKAENS